jgi:hypothetical protein
MNRRTIAARLDKIERHAAVDPATWKARHDAHERACREWVDALIRGDDPGPVPADRSWPGPQDPERVRQGLLEEAAFKVLWLALSLDATAKELPPLTDGVVAEAQRSHAWLTDGLVATTRQFFGAMREYLKDMRKMEAAGRVGASDE